MNRITRYYLRSFSYLKELNICGTLLGLEYNLEVVANVLKFRDHPVVYQTYSGFLSCQNNDQLSGAIRDRNLLVI